MSDSLVEGETILGRLARMRGIGRTTNTSEENAIIAATARTNGFSENSGNTLEPVPGAKGSGNVEPITTLSPVQKLQPKAVNRDSTGA